MGRSADIEVFFVPSGKTEWDCGCRLQGRTDLPLCPEGRVEAAASVASLNGLHVQTVIAAPDEASILTAELIAAKNDARVRRIPGLAEVDLGLWQGLRESELIERFAKSYGQWRADPMGVTAPGGEPAEEGAARILDALARSLTRGNRESAAVVLRPLALGVVRAWLEGRPLGEVWSAGDVDSRRILRFVVSRERLKGLLEELRDSARTAAGR